MQGNEPSRYDRGEHGRRRKNEFLPRCIGMVFAFRDEFTSVLLSPKAVMRRYGERVERYEHIANSEDDSRKPEVINGRYG
jgi:hypothetical protein